MAASSPKLILLDTPHNPTGITLDADFLRKLGEIAPCPVVIDEAYGEFAVQTVLPDVAIGIPARRCCCGRLESLGDWRGFGWVMR